MYQKTNQYLNWGKLRICGRSRNGRIIVRHRSGGAKKNYRILDLKKFIWNVYGMVYSFYYDTIHNRMLLVVIYMNGIISYNIASEHVSFGYYIFNNHISGYKNPGYCFCVNKNIVGSYCFGIELYKNMGAQYVRTGGGYARVVTFKNNWCLIKLRSKSIIKVIWPCIPCVGRIRKNSFLLKKKKKASYFMYKGWKPAVRGVAMNPVDHPHGGGQGKTSGGRPSCNYRGTYTKGVRTRKINKRRNNAYMKILLKRGKV